MPFILNRCLTGKNLFFCLCFPICISTPRSDSIAPVSRNTWDSLVSIVKIRDSCLKERIAEIEDSLAPPIFSKLPTDQAEDLVKQASFFKNQEGRLFHAVINLDILKNSDITYSVSLITNGESGE
ncbi:MAG TPA: hypothetical protein VHW43_04145, partial [Puia sp.]|nr:hypothetical protein [Puia sp.]